MNQEKTIVILKLFEPACQLAPFCPEAPENYVKITFPHSLNGKFIYIHYFTYRPIGAYILSVLEYRANNNKILFFLRKSPNTICQTSSFTISSSVSSELNRVKINQSCLVIAEF